MTILKTLRLGFITGLISGILIGFGESLIILFTINKQGYLFSYFTLTQTIFLAIKGMLLYGVSLSIIMSGISILFYFLFKINAFKISRTKLICLYITIIYLLSTSTCLSFHAACVSENITKVYPGTTWLSSFCPLLCLIISLTLLSSLGIYSILNHIIPYCSKHIKKTIILVCCFICILLTIFVILISLKKTAHANTLSSLPQRSGNKPNIVWIVIDSLRADHLSCYGYSRNTSPCIDAIAKEGYLFKNSFSTAPYSLPSYTSMFTGLYSKEHHVYSEEQGNQLNNNFITIAEILRDNGYVTFSYPKNDFCYTPYFNLRQGFQTLGPIEPEFLLTSLFESPDDGAGIANLVVKNWIKKSVQRKIPFFIFINYEEVHSPYGNTSLKNVFRKISATADMRNKINNNFDPASAVEREALSYLYDDDIRYIDNKINQLIDYLKTLHILDNSLIIINSDHGDHLGDHNRIEHGNSLYESLLHVPLIIRYPKIFRQNTIIDAQVQLTDIFPTILKILNVNNPSQNQGNNLLNTKNEKRPFAFAEVSGPIHGQRSIRAQDGFKYIWKFSEKNELYNLNNDPNEEKDIIDLFPQKAKELQKELDCWVNSP